MCHAICIPPLSLTKNKLIYIFHPNGQKERGEKDNTDQQNTIQDLHETHKKCNERVSSSCFNSGPRCAIV
jgi:hypothetical protein